MRRFFRNLLFFIVFLLVLIVAFSVYQSDQMPELKKWHTLKPGKELLLTKDYPDINSYLKDEDAYIRKIFEEVADSSLDRHNRYNPSSYYYPLKNGDNLNASFVYDPGKENTKAAVLLVHGLSDSPYYMRDLGKFFKDKGYYVFGLRLPGHGTLPSGLLEVKWQDWAKAVKWAAAQVHKISVERGNKPFYMGGFSTGGALIINYSFLGLDDKTLFEPDRIFLFSPAAGVTPLAKFSAMHKALSWIPSLGNLRWLDILPEYNPVKYNSFTKNAARQIYLLTKENQRLAKEIAHDGKQKDLPPTLAFQSMVDATVVADDLIKLYKELGTAKDRLFLFDVNRMYRFIIKKEVLENCDPRKVSFAGDNAPQLHLLLNKPKPDSLYGPIVCGVYKPDKEGFTNIWPDSLITWSVNCFAISHISVPVSPYNKLFGSSGFYGGFDVHGENDVLIFPANDILRVQYNPFFDVMTYEINDFISE